MLSVLRNFISMHSYTLIMVRIDVFKIIVFPWNNIPSTKTDAGFPKTKVLD